MTGGLVLVIRCRGGDVPTTPRFGVTLDQPDGWAFPSVETGKWARASIFMVEALHFVF
jgi:hypothetical protein